MVVRVGPCDVLRRKGRGGTAGGRCRAKAVGWGEGNAAVRRLEQFAVLGAGDVLDQRLVGEDSDLPSGKADEGDEPREAEACPALP